MSDAVPSASPRACSGEAYSGVKARPASRVSAVASATPPSSSLAMPKSSSLAWLSAVTRMLAGFRSRCTTSWPWAYATACATWLNRRSRCGQPRRAARDPGVDAFALDQLQRQPRLPVFRHACVVQPGDVRVRQRGQDLAFALQPFGQARQPPAAVRQLQGDAAPGQHVAALGQPHRAHAAAAELANQPVRPHALGHGYRGREGAGLHARQRLCQRGAAFGRGRAGPAAAAPCRRLAAPGPAATRRAPAAAASGASSSSSRSRSQRGGSRSNGAAIGDRGASGAHVFSASARNKRACDQSRRTVRSVMPSACATSSSVRPAK